MSRYLGIVPTIILLFILGILILNFISKEYQREYLHDYKRIQNLGTNLYVVDIFNFNKSIGKFLEENDLEIQDIEMSNGHMVYIITKEREYK